MLFRSLARYLARIGEMTESIKIIQQALEGILGGPDFLLVIGKEGAWVCYRNGPSLFLSLALNHQQRQTTRRISNVEVAHTAWNILQTVHEGTKAVKINKLQQLTTRFESIRMSDDFDEFYAKLNDIVNSAYNLGEIYDQPKIFRKILRSLTGDFRPKMTAIIESKDVDSIPVDELVGFLQSYKLDLPKTNKSKSMALKSVDDVDSNGFDVELFSTEIASLLQKLHILPRSLETFLGITTEWQEVKTMLNLEILRGINPLK